MQKKYGAALLMACAFASCAVAYEVSDGPGGYRGMGPSGSDSHLQMLDGRLAAKVTEYMELANLLAAQLDKAQQAQGRERKLPMLIGTDVAPVPPPQPVAAVPMVPEAPWWSAYRLSMVMISDDARSAVINGRYVRAGESVGPDVVVREVTPGNVVLEHGGERVTLSMK